MPKFKFGDLVYNITEKRDPKSGDEELYIGLEHLDSGSLRVTRWGSKVELKGTKLVMKAGDVLFGRRNTYLRRVAIAPHDGLFSAHGMIFRAKEEHIDKNYLLFFIASDYFMEEAIRISVGSLSPTVNWTELKELEFNIPELQTQRELAKTLMAANELKERYEELLSKTDELVKSQFIEMFGDPILNERGWKIGKLSDVAELKIGPFGSLLHKEDYIIGGHALINPSHIVNGRIETDPALSLSDKKYKELPAYHLRVGDVVLGRRGEMGRCAVVYEEGMFCGTGSMIVRPNGKILPYFLQSVISSPSMKALIEERAVGVTMANLNVPIVANLPMPIYPMDKQKSYIQFMQQTDKSKFELKKAIESTAELIRSLMRQDFTN